MIHPCDGQTDGRTDDSIIASSAFCRALKCIFVDNAILATLDHY